MIYQELAHLLISDEQENIEKQLSEHIPSLHLKRGRAPVKGKLLCGDIIKGFVLRNI